MQVFFSPAANAFYPKDYEKAYKSSGSWPVDLVEVSEQDFNTFGLQTPPAGMTRGFVNNSLCWVVQKYSDEQIKQAEVVWTEYEIDRARDELEKVQDSDPASFGSVSDWRSYRKNLRVWPTHENFPNKEFRPKAPDA